MKRIGLDGEAKRYPQSPKAGPDRRPASERLSLLQSALCLAHDENTGSTLKIPLSIEDSGMF